VMLRGFLWALCLCFSLPTWAQSQKVAYFELETTAPKHRNTLEMANPIVWQQLKTIEGVSEHVLTKRDVRRLKKCKGKTKCLKRWLKKRGVFALFYVKVTDRDEERHAGISFRYLDVNGGKRFKNHNLVWTYDADLLNYDVEVLVRRWLKPRSLKGTLKVTGLTADTQIWLNETPLSEGLMKEVFTKQMMAGTHSLRVERNGYVPYAKNFSIDHRKETEVAVDWRIDPLHEMNQGLGEFNPERTEVLIGAGVAGAGALTWLGAAIGTLVIGAEVEKRAQAQMLFGETHEELVRQGQTAAWVANAGLGLVAMAAGWCAYWGFTPEEESP